MWILFNVAIGVICAIIAANKGRNAVGWFLIGFFLHFIGLIIVCVVSNLKEEQARYHRAAAERRRLREELKMERMRAKKFESLANRRLDVHDRALGIETAEEHAPPELARPVTAGAIAGPAKPKTDSWYYAPDGRDAIGPVSLDALADAYRNGQFGSADLVWKSGWKEWRALGEVDGLEDTLLRAR